MSLKKQYLFIKKLESLYRSSRSLASSIDLLIDNEKRGFLKRAFKTISADIHAGSSLHAALSKHNIIDDTYLALIKVGEVSGRLDVVFLQILDLLDNLIKIRKKIISAAVYPLVVLSVYALVISVFLFVVVPMLVTFLTTYNVEIPEILTMYVSIITPVNCCVCFPIFLLLLMAFYYIFINIDSLSMFRSFIFIFIPGFGQLDKCKNLFSYVYTMKVCDQSGVSVIEASELSALNVDNAYMSDVFYNAYERIRNGQTVYESLSQTKFFNYEMIDLVRVAEESGTMEESYEEIIKMINDKINLTVAIMIGMIKPLGVIIGLLLLIGVFLFVGIIVFSILVKVKNVLP
ncbi:MAG: type II secretion system F family protein [Vampirovibrionia bacterium]